MDINTLIRQDNIRRGLADLESYRTILLEIFSQRPSMAGKSHEQIYKEMTESIKAEPLGFIILITKLKSDGKLE